MMCDGTVRKHSVLLVICWYSSSVPGFLSYMIMTILYPYAVSPRISQLESYAAYAVFDSYLFKGRNYFGREL
jgi:hypothetical protein